MVHGFCTSADKGRSGGVGGKKNVVHRCCVYPWMPVEVAIGCMLYAHIRRASGILRVVCSGFRAEIVGRDSKVQVCKLFYPKTNAVSVVASRRVTLRRCPKMHW